MVNKKVKFWKYGKEAIYAGLIHGGSHYVGENIFALNVVNNIYFAGTIVTVWVGYRFWNLLTHRKK